MYMYADDIAIGSTSKETLQDTLNKVYEWANQNKLDINKQKTVHMVFRQGGRLKQDDHINLGPEALNTVNTFKYLGLTFQTKMTCFTNHVKDRTTAAIRAIYDIQNLTRLSINTAMLLFKTKIVPILTYGMQLIWEQLTMSNLEEIEKVKARFLKATLGVSKYTKSRLVYELTREPFLLEDLHMEQQMQNTKQYAQVLKKEYDKKKEIWRDFYSTDAMVYRQWTQTNQDYRSAITRMAIHGYHHKICKNTSYHEPDITCVCSLCEESCERYHLQDCKKRTKSLMEYSKE